MEYYNPNMGTSFCRTCPSYAQPTPYEPWQGMQRGMPLHQPMPYYMAHPYPLVMDGTEDDEKDMERLMSMFPKTARYIQPMVEDECDRMEYDGSLMFDEYPDKIMLQKLVDSIETRVQATASEDVGMQEDEMFATQCKNCGDNRVSGSLRDLISVMLFEEMHRRRCRHRRCKRWW